MATAASTAKSPPSLGNLVRLQALSPLELPTHPLLELHAASSADISRLADPPSRPALRTFLSTLLAEALHFADTAIPATFTSKGSKSAAPSAAKVELLTRSIPAAALASATSPVPRPLSFAAAARRPAAESWFARRSRHVNRMGPGTANWVEFDHGLRLEHSEKERLYTPAVYDSYRVLDWDKEILADGLPPVFRAQGFDGVDARVYEMCHRLPWPLRPRCFSVLVVTARTVPGGAGGTGPGREGLLVVQVPIDLSTLKEALYSNGRNAVEGLDGLKGKRVVSGVYTSVERALVTGGGEVEWVMGTASDAKGWLPMWAQKLGVPGAVVKDVGLFVGWVGRNRKGGS